MHNAALIPNQNSHLSKVIIDLIRYGWNIHSIPGDARIPRNGLKVVLKAGGQEFKIRVFAYKVTTSGRNRPHERRIEIINTYQSGLSRLSEYQDVVLGMDMDTGKYVGVDSRRLNMGGPTHNASSFFDLEGLSVKTGELLVNPRVVVSIQFPGGVEQHAFFDSSRLSEYLANQQDVHSGRYAYQGIFSGVLPLRSISWPSSKYEASSDVLVLSSSVKTREVNVARIVPPSHGNRGERLFQTWRDFSSAVQGAIEHLR